VNFDYYRPFGSVEVITDKMRKEIPFFGKNSD
jgi:hypothetical protein